LPWPSLQTLHESLCSPSSSPPSPPKTFFLSVFCSRSLRPAANTQPSCYSAILLLLSLFFLLLWIATSFRDCFLERFWRRDSAGVRRPRGLRERRFFRRDIPIPIKAWPLMKALFIPAMAQRPNPRWPATPLSVRLR
jgi:hypothetical protein